jgi:hypothetical protein
MDFRNYFDIYNIEKTDNVDFFWSHHDSTTYARIGQVRLIYVS